MLLTADTGNTNTVFTVFENEINGRLIMESRINTDSARMADQYAVILQDILRLYGLKACDITGAIISSVVPPVTVQLKTAIEKICGVSAAIIGPGVKTGINIKIDDPSTLGGDLVCDAVAAKNLYPNPCIVIDLGTVTKVMAIDKEGALVGGIFFPGMRIGLEALSSNTAALPLVSTENGKMEKVICTNTVDCMRSGILNGMACMLDGIINKFEKEIGKCSVIATGGHASQIRPYCEREFEINPHLVSEGLRIIYNKNKY